MLKYFVLLLVILSVKIWSHLEKVVQDFKLLEGHAAYGCVRGSGGVGHAVIQVGWFVACIMRPSLKLSPPPFPLAAIVVWARKGAINFGRLLRRLLCRSS